MIEVRVSSNVRERGAELEQLSKTLQQRIIRGALNDAIKSAKTLAVRLAREDLNIKARDANKVVSVRPAFSKRGSGTALEASFTAHFRPLPLYAFDAKSKIVMSARGKRRGVTVKIMKRGVRKLVTGGFIAKMASGYVGVFARSGNKMRGGGDAITQLFGPTLSQVIGTPAISRQVEQHAAERFGFELDQRIRHELSRGRGAQAAALRA